MDTKYTLAGDTLPQTRKFTHLVLDVNRYSNQISAWETEPLAEPSGALASFGFIKSPKESLISRKKKNKKMKIRQLEQRDSTMEDLSPEVERLKRCPQTINSEKLLTQAAPSMYISPIPKTHRLKTLQSQPFKKIKNRQHSVACNKSSQIKFPPIYLSNFVYTPYSNHLSIKRSPVLSPGRYNSPTNPEIQMKATIMQRLKEGLKPDPFKIFRTKLLHLL